MILNASQQRAVAHLSGPMMVLAGPGSGKTSVIVERTRNLIMKEGAEPSSVLVVTFSRAAASEMKERFLAAMESTRTGVTFGTFHGIFYGILRQAYHLDAGNILGDKERFEILKELALCYSPELAGEGDFLEDLSREIGSVKSERIEIEHYYSSSCPDEVFRQIYRGYKESLKKRRKLDFDDMLLYCYELFVKRPDILALWQKRFRYILVDEFQDINPLQFDIVRMLAEPERNLFIVGDDDQSIYHFRGARPELMLRFPDVYPDTDQVVLDVNYRCSGHILLAASKVIRHNRRRFEKKIHTPNPDGLPVRSLLFEDPAEEYRFAARYIRKGLDSGESPGEMAVLFRTNQEAEEIARLFMDEKIPFVVREQLPDMFAHWIARDMRCYLHMAAGEMTRKNFVPVMNHPNRYISRDAIRGDRIDLDSLRAFYRDKDWMQDRITTLETPLKVLSGLSPFAGINFIRKGMGYEEYLQEYAAYRKIKYEDLEELLEQIHESTKGCRTLGDWEASIERYEEKLAEQSRQKDEKTEGVTLSTLHRAKGLEYDRVFIVNVNEGTIPYRKAVLPEALEEERRLFYVGMTRARKALFLCHVKQQYGKKKEPSRFLGEAEL